MPFRVGQPKPPNSGRKLGVPNKSIRGLCGRLAELGLDPLQELVSIVKDEKTSVKLRARICMELMQYMYPKLRRVEYRPLSHEAAAPAPSREVRNIAEMPQLALTSPTAASGKPSVAA